MEKKLHNDGKIISTIFKEITVVRGNLCKMSDITSLLRAKSTHMQFGFENI